jgi:hypothetical protein
MDGVRDGQLDRSEVREECLDSIIGGSGSGRWRISGLATFRNALPGCCVIVGMEITAGCSFGGLFRKYFSGVVFPDVASTLPLSSSLKTVASSDSMPKENWGVLGDSLSGVVRVAIGVP